MIARTWSAQATLDGAREYRDHFEKSILSALRRIKGFRRAEILTREHDHVVQFEVHTLWESFDAIRSFAGADLNAAVIDADAKATLLSYEETVSHFMVREYGAV